MKTARSVYYKIIDPVIIASKHKNIEAVPSFSVTKYFLVHTVRHLPGEAILPDVRSINAPNNIVDVVFILHFPSVFFHHFSGWHVNDVWLEAL